MIDLLVSLFLLIGAGFALVGSIGLARLPDFYMRLHAPTKATTLGVGGMLIASMLHFSHGLNGISLHELLITLFLFATAPVSAHLLAKTALHLEIPPPPGTAGNAPPADRAAPGQDGRSPPDP